MLSTYASYVADGVWNTSIVLQSVMTIDSSTLTPISETAQRRNPPGGRIPAGRGADQGWLRVAAAVLVYVSPVWLSVISTMAV